MNSRVDAVLDRRYRLTRRLGRGGMADVWAAEDLVLQRPVAIKVFRFDTPGAEQERIDAEMRTIAQLSHPGIVGLFDAGAAADPTGGDGARVPYLVMELVHGPTLEDRLARGPLTMGEVRDLGAQLADTFAYLHGRGVVHRDVKPANILLQAAEGGRPAAPFRARLTDFGVARLVDSARITEIGMTIGTANYLSPEQAVGAEAGPPSDIYALGLVLLECCTGRLAYPGTGVAAATARLYRPPAIPDTLGPRWAPLLAAMTAAEPSDRPTAEDVAAALAHLPDADPLGSTRVLPAAAVGAVPARAPRAWWSTPAMLAALIGVVLLVVLVVVLTGGGGAPSPAPARTNSPAAPLNTDAPRGTDKPARTVTVTTGAPSPPAGHPVPPGHKPKPPKPKKPGHGPKGHRDEGDDG